MSADKRRSTQSTALTFRAQVLGSEASQGHPVPRGSRRGDFPEQQQQGGALAWAGRGCIEGQEESPCTLCPNPTALIGEGWQAVLFQTPSPGLLCDLL